MMQGQDWEQVVFRKKQPINREVQKFISEKIPKYIENLNNYKSEETALKRFDTQFIKDVINARIQKKWTQKDLSMHMNVSVSRINNFEQHKEVYDAQFKNKLNNILFR